MAVVENLSPALQSLPQDVRHLAHRQTYTAELKHGECIVKADHEPIGAVFVVKGAIKVSRKQVDGSEVVMCFARPQTWQMGQLVASGSVSRFDSSAVGKAEVVIWPRESFLHTYHAHESLRDYIRDCEVKIQQLILRELELSLALPLPQRLARRLLELAELTGSQINDQQSIRLGAPVSNALLAASLGVTRQRIHSQIREWSERGWVQSSYREVVLHAPDALRGAAAYA